MHPRPYLSHSQLILWEASPELYKQKYLEGKVFGTNRGQALGREIAEAMESEEETGDPIKDFVIAQLPKYAIRDKEFRTILKLGENTVPILIKPDSVKSDFSAFHEIKTGTTPWSQKKVDEDSQLDFYSMGIYSITKKIPDCDLAWAPCELFDGKPRLTGEVRVFQSKRDMQAILKMMSRCVKAWREIGAMVDNQIL